MTRSELLRYDAPGLPADWLNAWLAAIGVTVLLDDVKLSWTDDVVPHAVFWVPEGVDLPEAIMDRLPEPSEFDAIVPRCVGRNPTIDEYVAAARAVRASGKDFLSMRLTDLVSGRYGEIGSGQFDVPAPGGRTIYDGAMDALMAITSADEVGDCLRGLNRRVKGNGLGFDSRRVSSGIGASDKDAKFIVPTVEALAFFGLSIFRVRARSDRAMQRNWTGTQFQRGAFRWFSWIPPLDCWAIDCVLDRPEFVADHAWQVAPFKPGNSADTTRYLFSERVAGG